jgi:hypothetical protein
MRQRSLLNCASSEPHALHRRSTFGGCKLADVSAPKTTVLVASLAGDATVPPPVARATEREPVAMSGVGQTAQSEGTSPRLACDAAREVVRSSPSLKLPEHPWSPTRGLRRAGDSLPAAGRSRPPFTGLPAKGDRLVRVGMLSTAGHPAHGDRSPRFPPAAALPPRRPYAFA